MCPFCLATAAWVAAATISTGGITALVLKRTVADRAASNNSNNSPSKEDHHG